MKTKGLLTPHDRQFWRLLPFIFVGTTRAARLMDVPKLQVSQFRMLQCIPDEGLTQTALQQTHGYGIGSLRSLRSLILRDLVVKTRSENGEVQFELTDSGCRPARSD